MRAILTYHSIDPSGSPISIDERTLRRHVEFFRSGRVAVVGLDELVRRPAHEDALAITFDDGFENFASSAWPLFEAHKLPVTLFVASRRVGANNAWDGTDAAGIPTLPLLDWGALRKLISRGLNIGSHSREHPRLTRCDDRQLQDELEGSAADLQTELGTRPTHFCYPYGDLDERVVAATRRVYSSACTTQLAVVPEACDPLRLPRLDAYYYRAPGLLETWGSPSFRAHLWLRARARSLRALLRG